MVKLKYQSFQNVSILRKFSIYYFLMSILPIGFLLYLDIEFREHGRIIMPEDQYSLAVMIIVFGVSIGYVAMRMTLKGAIEINKANREMLEQTCGVEKLREITGTNVEIAGLARNFNEITSRLEQNVHQLENAQTTLFSALTKISRGISSLQNINSFLDLTLETVTIALNAKAGALFVLEENQTLLLRSVYGVSVGDKKSFLHVDEVAIGSAIKTKNALIISQLNTEDKAYKEYPELFQSPIICAPLCAHEKVQGIFVLSGHKTPESFKNEEMELLFNLASQTAVALENAKLNEDSERTYFETISALALAVEARDYFSRGHLERVARYSVLIAKKLQLSPEDIKTLRDAARIHDIGKIGITDDILTKPDTLNPQEWDAMKRHPEIGEAIIKPIRSLRHLGDLVRHHHEKLDGSGYPDGLKAEKIGILVRILTAADIYDALTAQRPYRRAFTREETIAELIKMVENGKIDARVVEALIATI